MSLPTIAPTTILVRSKYDRSLFSSDKSFTLVNVPDDYFLYMNNIWPLPFIGIETGFALRES